MTPIEILNKLHNNWDGSIPVNMTKLASACGVSAQMIENLAKISQIHQGDKTFIYCNAQATPMRQRFAIAQALVRCLMIPMEHKTTISLTTKDFNYDTLVNKAINQIVGKILVPDNILMFAINQKGIVNVEKLSQLFGISQLLISYRIKETLNK